MSLNKSCAQCRQIVYPLEQLKCLDQVWHRKCFRCEKCGMALNMQNYRGYDKKPYCSAHYPQPKRFTVIADTPEMQRVAQNSRVLSDATYRQDFYRTKGHSLQTIHSPQLPPLSQGPNSQSSDTRPYNHHHNQVVDYALDQDRNSTQAAPRMNSTGQTFRSWSTTSPSVNRSSYVGNGHHQPSIGNGSYTSNGYTGMYYSGQYGIQQGGRSDISTEFTEPSDNHFHSPTDVGYNTQTSDYRSSNPNTKYRAMYDYEAREDDEVTFIEGDIILNGDPITEGWMYGTVQRTGQFGMLPSNYVEPI
ncbi:hypothetical protein CRM22_006237 [Opisthorchis felineus]|uniref:LIM zinc-binding domain-containing protein n=1 Tax=Opisthorchis felineus TaxID=147828 RepID=A0A4S2LM36_OPIFE|nr:hypothetical protein CRM22_006237 [Opisthorchis felineus]